MRKGLVASLIVLAAVTLGCRPYDEVKIPTITSTPDTTQVPTEDPTRPRIHPPKEGDH